MLAEKFHWPPGDLAKADIDMILPLAVYYPHWKNRSKQPAQEERVYVDQVDFL